MSSPMPFGIRQQRQIILEYVEDAHAATGNLVPGGLGQFYKAVDGLVATDGQSRDYVSRVATTLRRLNDTLRSRAADEQEVTRLRDDLYDTARQWIVNTPSFHSDDTARA
ncbi:MAG: hypothetical protein JWL96_3813 [Sphingomonas bacterium]|uniref:hypothetical protein n=1 Tax=Sphingomonas bacterium TaxID=1895847 RepID=UPI00261C0D5C|nr:hypothetical protein [Sphingomonas bacterium]MDB5711743.1 hypothetical protein [Sphingomonas bacterium]